MDVIYEPHPVTPERKAELREQGLRIVDIRFKPQEVSDPIPTREDISVMKKAELIEWLAAHEAETEGKVPELRERLSAVMFVEA